MYCVTDSGVTSGKWSVAFVWLCDEVEATPKMFVEPGWQWPRLSMVAHARRSIILCSTLFVHSQSISIGVSPFQYSRKVAASSVSPLTFGTGVPFMLHANGGAMFV